MLFSNICAIETTDTLMTTRSIPTAHVLRAGLHVAGVIDSFGSSVSRARITYVHYASGGIYPPEDLIKGEQVLIDCGLIRVEEGMLRPSPELHDFVAAPESDATIAMLFKMVTSLPANPFRGSQSPSEALQILEKIIADPERREAFLIAIGKHFDDGVRVKLGEQGEERVVEALRSELKELDRTDSRFSSSSCECPIRSNWIRRCSPQDRPRY